MEKAAQATVRFVNTYTDGHQSTITKQLPLPSDLTNPTVLSDWWEGVVFPETGDSHTDEPGVDGYYEATVIEGPAGLVNKTYEW